MASRSSRSSLLGPPATVAEDDDSIMNGARDEDPTNWHLPRSSRQELDRMVLSPQVERAIRGFNEEIEELTKTMEELLKRKSRNSITTTSSTRTPRAPAGSNAKDMGFSQREKDPPPSVQPSPLRSYIQGTPAKRSGSASYTPSEPPPAPVETPGFGSPTPNRHRSRRTTAPAPPPRVDESYVFSQHEPTPTRQRDSRDAKLEEIYNIVREQEIRIRDLEIENEVLRKKLQLVPPTVERVHRASSIMDDFFPGSQQDAGPKHQTSHHHPQTGASVEARRDRSERSPFPEEPQGRHQSFDDSPYRPQSSYFSTPSRRVVEHPPRQIHTLGDAIQQQTDFTPGTRFVAELSALMHLEKSHLVPLSFMIDKHWDRLKKHFRGNNEQE